MVLQVELSFNWVYARDQTLDGAGGGHSIPDKIIWTEKRPPKIHPLASKKLI